MSATAHSRIQYKPLIIWVLRILMGLAFLAAAAMKLSSQPMMVAEFDQLGLGQWFRFFTGALEAIGGIAILVPSLSLWGAALLLLVDAGAFVAQISVLHMGWLHTLVMAIPLALLIHLQRDASAAP